MKSSIILYHRMNHCIFQGIANHPVFISVWRKFSNWHLVGALCLERKPIITQEMIPLEKKYSQYLNKLEVEKSFLSNHEKRMLEDLKVADKMKKGEMEDMDTVLKQTAQDFEDASVEEFNKFKSSSRETEADMKNDQCSVQRKLDSSLIFIIKQKIGNDHRWILPQAVHQGRETLRETAERAFYDIFPSQVKIQMMGNAPVGYYKYKYPKVVRSNGVCGAKVFFFKAQFLDKNLDIKQTDSVLDHMWLTSYELEHFLQPVYRKVVQSFLYPITVEFEEKHSCSDEDELPVLKSSISN